jgi:hypothetical protein
MNLRLENGAWMCIWKQMMLRNWRAQYLELVIEFLRAANIRQRLR